MSDIFLSYATADRERARELAQALAARGWSVWWDREIPFGESFDRVIERELARARSVVVLWTRASVDSDWVRNEARRGLRRDVLIPVQLEPVDLPLEFSNVQTAELTDWRPDQAHPAFDKLVQRLNALLVQPPAGEPPSPAPPPEPLAARRPFEEGPRHGHRATKRAAWLVAVLALLAAVGVAYWIAGRSEVEVPDLIGKPAGAVPAILASSGLAQGRTTPSETSRWPPGTVADQIPLPGSRVRRGATVELAIAATPKVVLPAVVDQPLDQARATLKAAGLAVGRVNYRKVQAVRPGTVIDQSPRAGEKAEAGAAVDVVVAAAADVEAPDLTAMPLSRAREVLRGAGLQVGSTVVAGRFAADEGAEPKVRSQEPKAGTRVARGSAVRLVLAEPGVRVPALVNVTLGDARAALERAGLAVGAVRETSEANARPGIVVAQAQGAGALVARGARIDLTVAGKTAGIVMPDLVGMYWVNAYQVVQESGLKVVRPEGKLTAEAPVGLVLSQSHRAGTRVAPDTVIRVVYAQRQRAFPVTPPPQSKDEAAKVCLAVCGEQKMKWNKWDPRKPHLCYCTL